MALNPDDFFDIPIEPKKATSDDNVAKKASSDEILVKKASNVTVKAPSAVQPSVVPTKASEMVQRIPRKPKDKEKRKKEDKKKKRGPMKREKMKDGEMVKSESFTWQVTRLLGSGGFGDVYKVYKKENEDKKEYAMKTEMVEGNKLFLRLKIEVTVLQSCHEIENPDKKKHFVDFVDKGITDRFKFMVMGLVGPSLEDIRKSYLLKNYSKATAMNASIQTLRALADLHSTGWLHRDIKPQNYAVGLGEKENVIYILDFGIARKIFNGDTKEIKPARTKVKFLGTLRFASRACHHGVEQGRKDDLETWLYMAFDLFDYEHGLPWKKAADKKAVVTYKEKFFKHKYPKSYGIVPKEFKKIVDYINGMAYADEPDYAFIETSIKLICKEKGINPTKKLDWIGKLKKKPSVSDDSSTSSDNKQSGSEDSDSETRRERKKPSNKRSKPSKPAASTRKKGSKVPSKKT